MAENLQKYLDKYKEQLDSDKLFSDARLRSNTEKSKPKAINPKANFFSKHKGLLTMITIGMTIISLMMMVSSGEEIVQLQAVNTSDTVAEIISDDDILIEIELTDDIEITSNDEITAIAKTQIPSSGISNKEIEPKTAATVLAEDNEESSKSEIELYANLDYPEEIEFEDEIFFDDSIDEADDSIDKDNIDENNLDDNNQDQDTSNTKPSSFDRFLESIHDTSSVGGVVYLELTIEEMEAIGIKKINDSYNFRYQDSYIDEGSTTFARAFVSILEFFGFDSDNVFYDCSVGSMFINQEIEKGQKWGSREVDRTLPVSVTVYENHYTKAVGSKIFGNTCRYYENNWKSPLIKEFAPGIKPQNLGFYSSAGRDGEYSKNIDRLLPVSIFYGDPAEPDSSKLRYGNIQIWYIATKELAELLPPRYSEPILKELELLTSIENGTIPLKEACRQMEDQTSYFNMCTMTSRTIEYVKVYPNPVSDQLTCEFELIETSNIRIALFAQSGSFIKYLSRSQKLASAVHSITMQLPDDLSAGVYLIAVMSDNGDRVITKIIAE